MTFVAMNDQAICPYCESIRLEDWGEDIHVMGGLSGNSKNSDANFRRIADRYGLTDMSNKDGKPVGVKPAPAIDHNGPMVNVGGIQIPAAQAASGGCVNIPSAAKPMKPMGMPNITPNKSLKGMTNVVAEHKGEA